jgi:hypothetical protein
MNWLFKRCMQKERVCVCVFVSSRARTHAHTTHTPTTQALQELCQGTCVDLSDVDKQHVSMLQGLAHADLLHLVSLPCTYYSPHTHTRTHAHTHTTYRLAEADLSDSVRIRIWRIHICVNRPHAHHHHTNRHTPNSRKSFI